MARTNGSAAETLAPAIREAVRAVDPQSPVGYEASFRDVVRETFARPREMAWLLGAFASLALVLSALGVYAAMEQLTSARLLEIGIRIALGARPADVVTLVVGHAVALTAVGVAIGVVLAPAALKLVSGLLFGVGPYSLTTLLAVSALLGGVSVAASAIPAVRAARVRSLPLR